VLYPTNGAVWNLVNDAGVRVWLHQKADGTGWEDCFDYGQAYNLSGRDVSAKSLGVSTNPRLVHPVRVVSNAIIASCLTQSPSAFQALFATTDLMLHISGRPTVFSSIPRGNRVWLHQDLNGGGWADCFSNNNAYLTSGTRDDNPGNLYISANTSAC